jgi:hypothetical protein
MKSIPMLSLMFLVVSIVQTMANKVEKQIESIDETREKPNFSGFHMTPIESRVLNGYDFQSLSNSRDTDEP